MADCDRLSGGSKQMGLESSLRNCIALELRQAQRRVDVRNLFCMSSDYLPFILEGIAAARPAGFDASFPPWSHTRMDTSDKIPPDWI